MEERRPSDNLDTTYVELVMESLFEYLVNYGWDNDLTFKVCEVVAKDDRATEKENIEKVMREWNNRDFSHEMIRCVNAWRLLSC